MGEIEGSWDPSGHRNSSGLQRWGSVLRWRQRNRRDKAWFGSSPRFPYICPFPGRHQPKEDISGSLDQLLFKTEHTLLNLTVDCGDCSQDFSQSALTWHMLLRFFFFLWPSLELGNHVWNDLSPTFINPFCLLIPDLSFSLRAVLFSRS